MNSLLQISLNLFLVVLVGVTQSASAKEFFEEWTEGDDGVIAKELVVRCNASTKDGYFCNNLCSNRGECRQVESYCRNCNGTGNFLLRDFFLTVGRKYVASVETVGDAELLDFLINKIYVTIGPVSTFNFYTAVDDPSLMKRFASLCTNGDVSPVVLLELDENHVPTEFEYLLCKNGKGGTNSFRVRVNNDVEVNSIRGNFEKLY